MEGNNHRTLVAGFGNLYRRDDGVARFVANALLERLGRAPLDALDDGFETLGYPVDRAGAAPTCAGVGRNREGLRAHHFCGCARWRDDAGTAARRMVGSLISHPLCLPPDPPLDHIGAHAADVRCNAGRRAASIVGHDFDFGEGLSPETAALVEPAVERILAHVAALRTA